MQRIGKFGCCLVAGVALGVSAATLEVNQVKQRYPWNGLVDIDYTIALGEGEKFTVDDSVEVLMVNNDVSPAETNRAVCFLQAPLPMTAGKHRITWDANYDGFTNRIEKAKFIVKIVHHNESYMVITVKAGSGNNVTYPVDFLNGKPNGGFNTPEYKTDKIVLRRIPAGSYMAGSPADEANRSTAVGDETLHRVAISKPFYIGLFEVTQKQWYYLSNWGYTHTGDCYPVGGVRLDVVDNVVSGADWLNKKCKAKDEDGNYTVPVTGFNLPTEFQWEYACRAGTTHAFNTTDDFDNTSDVAQTNALAKLGRFKWNTGDGRGDPEAATFTVVGSYEPNAWGLYDMHGNLSEYCRSCYTANIVSLQEYVDPKGPAQGSPDSRLRVIRGGSYNDEGKTCRSASRVSVYRATSSATVGFRLVRELP